MFPPLLVELLEGLATLLGEVALLAALGRRLLVPCALVPLLEGVLRVLHLEEVLEGELLLRVRVTVRVTVRVRVADRVRDKVRDRVRVRDSPN